MEINRIILIGNGFDLAHGLKTKFEHFTDYIYKTEIDILEQKLKEFKHSNINNLFKYDSIFYSIKISTNESRGRLSEFEIDFKAINNPKEKFLFILSSQYTTDTNLFLHKALEENIDKWIDFEDIFFKNLKKTSTNDITRLNKEFEILKEHLEIYLSTIVEKEINENLWNANIFKILYEDGSCKDLNANYYKKKLTSLYNNPIQTITTTHSELLFPVKKFKIDHHVFVTFNYTSTHTLYDTDYTNNNQPQDVKNKLHTIHIHGKLNTPNSPIIFGHGDELCEEYKSIEKKNNNAFFKHIKSFAYLKNNNYKTLLSYLNDKEFQVIILGQSCGLADRTLLNTIFEHENCISIKPYYFLDEVNNFDNYDAITMNISRNFNDKKKFRDTIVNKEYCIPFSTNKKI